MPLKVIDTYYIGTVYSIVNLKLLLQLNKIIFDYNLPIVVII